MEASAKSESNRIKQLNSYGQSAWVDMLHRDLLASGEAARLVEMGVTGFTSNPTSLESGITETDAYDEALANYSGSDDPEKVFEDLAVQDIKNAADILRLAHERSDGRDGFVSVEVRPTHAYETNATVEDARRWIRLIDRPNVMVKVPGTPEGIPAVRTLIGEGINVNVTLLFSIDAYRDSANAYLNGLRDYMKAGSGTLQSINSVASFFVSRVDALVDRLIDEKVKETQALRVQELKGSIAIANARLAYSAFQEIFESEDFRNTESLGARKQRPLWASTSTKDPAYPATKYVDNLIGPDTVNTMPLETLQAFMESPVMVEETVTREVGQALNDVQELEGSGIMMKDVTSQLLKEGVEKFSTSYENALKAIEEKLVKVASG